MGAQAADAVMRAYRDGFTRQAVRLRLDAAYEGQESGRGKGYAWGFGGMSEFCLVFFNVKSPKPLECFRCWFSPSVLFG